MARALAKLSPPRLPRGLLVRDRLHRRLSDAAAAGSVWISAPAGAGKTTLAAAWARDSGRPLVWYDADDGDADASSFLHFLRSALIGRRASAARMPAPYRPDPRQSLAAVARSFVRRFYACLPARSLLVLDNVERIDPASDGFAVVEALLAQVPPDAVLVVAARVPPPPSLARARVGGALAVLDWNDLRLSVEETGRFAAARGVRLDDDEAASVHAVTDGWVAGVRLLAERPDGGAGATPERCQPLFDYIAAEVFGALDPEHQDLLLGLAPLPTVSAATAVALGGRAESAHALDALARDGFFVHRLPYAGACFRLHPLLRRFLLGVEARRLDAAARAGVRRRAAAALADAGEVDAAAALWTDLRDPEGLAALLESAGRTLIDQGRHRTLLGWLDAMPASADDARPMLALWRALALVPIVPEEAASRLASLWSALERTASEAALVDAWCAITDCQHALRRGRLGLEWQPVLERLLQRLAGDALAPLRRRALAAAVVAWAPDERTSAYETAALELVRDPATPPDTRLLLAHRLYVRELTFRGARPLGADTAAAMRRLCADGTGSAMPRLLWLQIDGVERGWRDPDEALAATRQAIALASTILAEQGIDDYSYVDMLRMMVAQQTADDAGAGAAAASLEALRPSGAPMEATHRHAHLASYRLSLGDAAAALAHADSAVRAADAGDGVWQRVQFRCLWARAAARLGRRRDALLALRDALRLVRRLQVGMPRCGPWLTAAAMSLDAARPASALAFARRGLQAMAEHGVLRPSATVLSRAELVALLALAWRHGVVRDWVQRVVHARRLPPPDGAGADDWPWQVRIRTFGAFEIERGGRPLAFGRKPPRKVLDLLRWLLAAGERPAAVSRAIDALWPDCDGDAAYHAFVTALHRLRKLLGDDAVRHADGRAAIDLAVVWVDRVEFERSLHAPDAAALQRALALYRGPFLDGHDGAWSAAARDRLAAKFRQAAAALVDRIPDRLARCGESVIDR